MPDYLKDFVFHFLIKIKKLLKQENSLILVDRDRCLGYIASPGISIKEVKDIIYSLTTANYYKGPEKDRNGIGEVMIFKKDYNNTTIYIKLKIENEKIKCISFHNDEKYL